MKTPTHFLPSSVTRSHYALGAGTAVSHISKSLPSAALKGGVSGGRVNTGFSACRQGTMGHVVLRCREAAAKHAGNSGSCEKRQDNIKGDLFK